MIEKLIFIFHYEIFEKSDTLNKTFVLSPNEYINNILFKIYKIIFRLYWSDVDGIYSSDLDGANAMHYGGTAQHNFVDLAFQGVSLFLELFVSFTA